MPGYEPASGELPVLGENIESELLRPLELSSLSVSASLGAVPCIFFLSWPSNEPLSQFLPHLALARKSPPDHDTNTMSSPGSELPGPGLPSRRSSVVVLKTRLETNVLFDLKTFWRGERVSRR